MIAAVSEIISTFIMIATFVLGFIYLRKILSNYFNAEIPIVLASAFGAMCGGMFTSVLTQILVTYIQIGQEIVQAVKG